MSYTVSEWLNLALRWAHVFAAILWVGATYYFTWLDGQLRKSGAGGVWMVHSGGFYTVVKQNTLGVDPKDVHWFRWEAFATWITGLALLGVVYYGGGLLVDADSSISTSAAVAIAIAFLIVGWTVYDLLVRSPLVRSDVAFAVVCFVLVIGAAVALHQVLSARATYIHVGALFGTIMAANVWMRILPPQRRMIAAMTRGERVDPSLGAGAKERSKHNTFMAVPTVFIMISNHFPTATYGNQYAVAVLGALILVGWAAAAAIRRG